MWVCPKCGRSFKSHYCKKPRMTIESDKFQFWREYKMKNDILRTAISIIVGYFVLWYAGAMFNFFPFLGDDLTLRAVGFTGLLICLVIVLCTCWIINEIKKDK